MIVDKDDWSESELAEADNYTRTIETSLAHIMAQLRMMEVPLFAEKRAAVELTAVLEVAARIAADELRISDDDFALHAGDVFARRSN